MAERPVVAIVTGANRGIGQAIVQSLALQPPSTPLLVYAASRGGIDLKIQPVAHVQIKYPKLDIGDQASIKSFMHDVERNSGSVDVLINNAGVHLDDEYSAQNVRKTLDINFRGTLHMCQAFIPLLSKTGRIVNVSSIGSSLGNYSPAVQERFRNPKMTMSDLEALMAEFEKCAEDGTEKQNGWSPRAYGVSKAGINGLTAVLTRQHPGLICNACCPGWVSTDMGRLTGSPSKTPIEGARIPIKLGFKDIDGVTGRYWANPSVSGTQEGQVMQW